MLTPEQRKAILEAKAQGLTKEQAFAKAFVNASSRPTPADRRKETFGDVKDAFLGVGTDLVGRGEAIKESFRAGVRGDQTPLETGFQTAGNVLGGAFDIATRGAVGAFSLFADQETEDAASNAISGAVQKTGIPDAINSMSPRTKRNVDAGMNVFSALTLGSGNMLTRPFQNMFKRGVTTETKALVSGVDDVIAKADDTLKRQAQDVNIDPRVREEAARSSLTFKERYIGLEPDVKTRLQKMGPNKLQEYLDAVHRRNIDDTAPTPFEVGSQNVNTAVEQLQKVLNETGSGIGQTRRKLATVSIAQPSIESIERKFVDELGKLNLTIKNGEIITKSGSIAGTSAASDIKVLNALYKDLLTFKQSPTLKNAIDLRMAFDGRIKFGKSARDVSNSVDPLSRSVRSVIASEAAKTVGKTNAAELQKYADFMEAYGDLKSYTERAAGGEYLLRLVLSGRGGDSRKLIETINEYTGVDLMNDATAMKVATELLGNQNTQNLFKQEVTKAGYDVATVLRGDAMGMLEMGIRKLAEVGIDPEDVLKAAAAGTGGYLLMTYAGEDGLTPAGLAVLSAMPSKARKEAIQQAEKIAKSTGKTLKLADGEKDAVLKRLMTSNSMTTASKTSQAGGQTVNMEDFDELQRLRDLAEKPKGLTDGEYLEAKAILDRYQGN